MNQSSIDQNGDSTKEEEEALIGKVRTSKRKISFTLEPERKKTLRFRKQTGAGTLKRDLKGKEGKQKSAGAAHVNTWE